MVHLEPENSVGLIGYAHKEQATHHFAAAQITLPAQLGTPSGIHL